MARSQRSGRALIGRRLQTDRAEVGAHLGLGLVHQHHAAGANVHHVAVAAPQLRATGRSVNQVCV